MTLCVISWPPGNFNPRSREGSDDRSCKRDKKSDISIHAPAKGATERLEVQQMLSCDFNPRSREGSDHAASFGSGLICNFNPRSREGSDSNSWQNIWINQEFQSTLPRRERLICSSTRCAGINISIHAPAKGATRSRKGGNYEHNYFNPRSREGSDYN